MKVTSSLLFFVVATVTLHAQYLETVRNANAFTIEVYKASSSRAGQQNIVLSPFSISNALAMMYPGARGKTAEEMKKVLHFSANLKKQNEEFQFLSNDLQQDGSPVTISNMLWMQQGAKFESGFLKTSSTYFGANFREVSFSDTKNTTLLINSTIEKQTRGKIKDLVKDLDIDTQIMLTNAIYFKDAWFTPFDPTKTKDAAFVASPGNSMTLPFMNYFNNHCNAFENEIVSILEIPFKHENFAFQILLPKISLEEFESDYFGAETYQTWVLDDDRFKVISIPRFTMDTETDVVPILKKSGMITPFRETVADFSGITPEHIGISKIYHRAFIEVNEAGAEAAAATGVGATERGMAPTREFIADRPFIFLIRDIRTGSILFIGKFVKQG